MRKIRGNIVIPGIALRIFNSEFAALAAVTGIVAKTEFSAVISHGLDRIGRHFLRRNGMCMSVPSMMFALYMLLYSVSLERLTTVASVSA